MNVPSPARLADLAARFGTMGNMTMHPHGEQISAYLDGMLDVRQTHQIARHISACDQCRFLQASLGETKKQLQEMSSPSVPGPEFWTATYRRLRTEGAARPARGASLHRSLSAGVRIPSRRWAAGVAVAAAIGAAIAGPLLMRSDQTVSPFVPAADAVDISSLVRAHAASAARQPLADPDRQAMLSADTDDGPGLSDAAPEALGDGANLAADAAH